MEWIPISTSVHPFPDSLQSTKQIVQYFKFSSSSLVEGTLQSSNPGASESFSGKRWYKALELILDRRARLQRTIFCFTSMPGCYGQGRGIASSPLKRVYWNMYRFNSLHGFFPSVIRYCEWRWRTECRTTPGGLWKEYPKIFECTTHMVQANLQRCAEHVRNMTNIETCWLKQWKSCRDFARILH